MNITELCFSGNLAAVQKDLSDHPEHLLHEETHQVGDLTVRLTPLFAATLAGQVQLAAHLLKLGASRSLSGNPLDFYTWICMAPKEKRWELLKLLPTGECSSLFQSIASGGTIWMQTPSSPELKMPNGLSPFHVAVIANTLNELPQRFVHPADGNKLIPFAGLSAVQLATFRVAIHCLFQNRIPLAFDDAYCEEIELAILTVNLERLRDHVAKGWDPAKPFIRGPFKDQTPLYLASERGLLDVVKFLVEDCRIDLTSIGKQSGRLGDTPFMAAVRIRHLPMIEYYLNNGCHPTQVNKDGTTSLSFAAQEGLLKVVMVLVNAGSKPQFPILSGKDRGKTPLYLAAERGLVEVVRYFIGKGCDPETALVGGEHDGMTPLFAAASKGCLEMVKYFVRRGICPKASLRTGRLKGWTPCAIAEKNHHPHIVSYLEKYGCTSEPPSLHVDVNQKSVIVSALNRGYGAVAERAEQWKEWANTPSPLSTEPGTWSKLWNSLPVMSDAEFAAFIYRN